MHKIKEQLIFFVIPILKIAFFLYVTQNLIGQLSSWIKIRILPHEHGVSSSNDNQIDR